MYAHIVIKINIIKPVTLYFDLSVLPEFKKLSNKIFRYKWNLRIDSGDQNPTDLIMAIKTLEGNVDHQNLIDSIRDIKIEEH